MNDDAPFQVDRALFERWRSHESGSADAPATLDPMLLAAYLDGRLDETGAAPIERLLAADPQALDELMNVRAEPIVPEIASARFLRDVQALVPPKSATVLPFARPPAAPRRVAKAWAAWGAVAASLVLISLVGFDVGMQAERTINGSPDTGSSIDIFDQSNGLLGDGVG